MNAILASRDFAKAMHVQDTVFMLVSGRKPRPSSMVQLQRQRGRSKPTHLRITFRPEQRPASAFSEDYFLLEPVGTAATQGYILLEHAGGCDAIRIEEAETVVADLRARLAAQQAMRSGAPAAVGFSQSFSIDEALRDAVLRLPANGVACDHESVIDVIGLGVLVGGFQAVSRLFVKVERSFLDKEAGLQIRQKALLPAAPIHNES